MTNKSTEKYSINFHDTRRITPKRVTSVRCPTPRHAALKQHSYLRRCWSGGEPFATLCKIWTVRDLNSKPPTHEARALTVWPTRRTQ